MTLTANFNKSAIAALVLLCASVTLKGQDSTPMPNFELKTNETGATKNYVARDSIKLVKDFSYTATPGKTFSAKIDNCLLFPPTANTYALPDGTITTDPTQGAVMGSIPGQFDVSASGAATYTIPINVPAGINGMQPQLGVMYNSQLGSGLLGLKCNLSGISVITRVNHDNYYDGDFHVISFDGNDPYELDGMRLSSGQSVEDKTLVESSEPFYVTDRETYSRVYPQGNSGDGPLWFKLVRKDGIVVEYGSDQNSRLSLTSAKGVFQWFITRVIDPNGNYIKYNYGASDNLGNNGKWIESIEYTLNDLTQHSADYRIQFNYTDIVQPAGFVGKYNDKIKCAKLLSDIGITQNSKTLYTYKVNYTYDKSYRIQDVTLVNDKNQKLQPTSFSWGEGILPVGKLSSIPGCKFLKGNFMNEGREEIFFVTHSSSTKESNIGISSINENGVATERCNKMIGDYTEWEVDFHLAADIDRDGHDEALLTRKKGSDLVVEVYNYKLELISSKTFSVSSADEFYKFTSGDYDGDLNSELIILIKNKSGARSAYLYDEKTFTQLQFADISSIDFSKLYQLLTGDFNGDGKSDILISYDTYTYLYQIEEGVITKVSLNMGDPDGIKNNWSVADLNNDGTSDMVGIEDENVFYISNFKMADNNTTFDPICHDDGGLDETPEMLVNYDHREIAYLKYQLVIADINGDSKLDFVILQRKVEFYAVTDAKLDKFRKNFFKKELNGEYTPLDNSVLKYESVDKGDYYLYTLYYKTNLESFINVENDAYDPYPSYEVRTIYAEFDGWDIFWGEDGTDAIFGDFVGNGQPILYLTYNRTGASNKTNVAGIYDLYKGAKKTHITAISPAYNNTTSITYGPLVSGNGFGPYSHYTKDDEASSTASIRQWASPLSVVTQVSYPTGIKVRYNYAGAKYHIGANGFIGFREMGSDYYVLDETSPYNSIRSFNKFDETHCFNYPEKVTTSVKGSETASTAWTFTINSLYNKHYEVLKSSETLIDNLKGTTVTTTYTNYDIYGNPQNIKTDNGVTQWAKAASYSANGSWCPNKPSIVTISNSTFRGSSEISIPPPTAYNYYSRTTTYEYDTKGNLIKTTTDPGDKNQVITEYPQNEYDGFGNPKLKKVTANGKTFSTRFVYHPSGRFLSEQTDVELGKTTSYLYDEILGAVTSKTDETGTATYEYNGFGQLIRSIAPDKRQLVSVLQWKGNMKDAPQDASYYKYDEASGSAPVYTWYDTLGREIRKDATGFDSHKIYVETKYNTKGLVESVTEPYFAISNDPKTNASEYLYDDYGRPTVVTTPMGKTNYTYDILVNQQFKTTVESPTDKVETTVNAAGQSIESKVNNKSVAYTYWPSGLVQKATPQDGVAVESFYDLQGNNIKMIDPDAGVVTSDFNALGQLNWTERRRTEAGALIARTACHYDDNGFLDSKTLTDAAGAVQTTTITYDPRYLPSKIEIEGLHSQTFTYDAFNRIEKIVENLGTEKQLAFQTVYDAFGRVAKEIYPSNYQIINSYDPNGYLSKVSDNLGHTVWEATAANARGQLLDVMLGGRKLSYAYDARGYNTSLFSDGIVNMAYVFDKQGNLYSREDGSTHQSERFVYDGANRLTDWNVYSNGVEAKTNSITYGDLLGNITAKSDLGGFTMKYGQNSCPPHAVTSIEGNPGPIPDNTQTATYTAFNKLASITEGDYSCALTYGVDQQRRKGVFVSKGQTTLTRYYFGKYEEEEKTGVPTRKIHYISAGNGLSAIYVKNGSADSLYYCYSDYQGNLLAVTDDKGATLDSMAYDPWGARRNPADWTQPDSRTNHRFARGYTLHEHLDDFGLINMNGRAYDPLLARFLNPDPFIQAPSNWGNYNRYAYCMNNPLIYSDPTGEFWQILVVAGFMYLKTAHDNRDMESGKWDWGLKNTFSKGGTLQVGVSTNSNFSNTTYYGGYGQPGNSLLVGYNTQNGVVGGYSNGNGSSFVSKKDWHSKQSGFNSSISSYRTTSGVNVYKSYSSILMAKILYNSPVLYQGGRLVPNLLYKAAAVGLDGGVNLFGIEGDIGISMILAGKGQGEYSFFREGAGGAGTGASASVEVVRYDYSMGNENVEMDYLYGHRYKGYVGFSAGADVGIGEAISILGEDVGFLYGTSFSAGIGVSLFGVEAGYNEGIIKPFW